MGRRKGFFEMYRQFVSEPSQIFASPGLGGSQNTDTGCLRIKMYVPTMMFGKHPSPTRKHSALLL